MLRVLRSQNLTKDCHQHSQAPANRAVAACLQESSLVSHPAMLNYQGAEEPPRLISDRPLAGRYSQCISGTSVQAYSAAVCCYICSFFDQITVFENNFCLCFCFCMRVWHPARELLSVIIGGSLNARQYPQCTKAVTVTDNR